MKGQASIEFVIMIGIGLVLAAPFVVQANDTMINLATDTDSAALHSDLKELESTGEKVASSPVHTRDKVEVDFPSNYEIYKFDEAFVVENDHGDRSTNHTVLFDMDLDAELPEEEGLFRITVENTGENLTMTNELVQ